MVSDVDEEPSIDLVYSAKDAYDLEDMTPATWQRLTDRMEADDNVYRTFYYNFYTDTGLVGPPSDEDKQYHLCNIRHRSYVDNVLCNRQGRS